MEMHEPCLRFPEGWLLHGHVTDEERGKVEDLKAQGPPEEMCYWCMIRNPLNVKPLGISGFRKVVDRKAIFSELRTK